MIYDEDGVRLYHGDAIDVLESLPAESVDCVVTSPPYWGLRAYSGEQQSAWAPEGYGAEPTPELYVAHTVEVLRAIRRVLKPSGVVWWNVGDSYMAQPAGNKTPSGFSQTRPSRRTNGTGAETVAVTKRAGVKPKDLVLIPFRVALAAQADGWWVRSDVIWAKPNPMPESVTDRPTKAHEYLFLLTKSERYFWDQDAVRERYAETTLGDRRFGDEVLAASKRVRNVGGRTDGYTTGGGCLGDPSAAGRNIRSVWTIPTQPSPLPHFAAFPDDLAERCIKAACPEKVCPVCGKCRERETERTPMVIDRSERTHELGRTRSSGTMLSPAESRTVGWTDCGCGEPFRGGVVLDPFAGTGTTLKVARQLGRRAIGIEISREYVELAVQRLRYGTRGTLAVRQGQGTLWDGA